MVLTLYITCILHLKYYLILNLNLNENIYSILFIKLLHNKYCFKTNVYNLSKNI